MIYLYSIIEGLFFTDFFSHSQDMQRIVRDYFFFKSIRNEINHASDNDTLSDDQKAYYSEFYTTNFTVNSLIKDMKSSIDFISNLSEN